ncbi:umecyanin-like [Gastrolobium bilobum]|uniref:umecyanin-like n=1 Tax=Gastrolobium bilobum TaxID=150636 RepID=UPI002AB19CB7|nr:umecyanin-like [Gastrolobium bilobum]
MVQLSKMAIVLVIVVAAAAIFQSTEAADHTVGGSTGWISSPSGGASFYSNWASSITFKENDVLVFNFATGSHTVAEITKTNFDSCNMNQNIQVLVTSPARFTLNRTGEFYFACSISGHCNSGQKLSVKVTGSSPAPGKAPSPAHSPSSPRPPVSGTTPPPSSNEGAPPPASPSEPGATPPPSPSSATSLAAATFSLLLTITVSNLLF